MSEKLYGICENKCLKEVHAKNDQQVYTKNNETTLGNADITFKRSGNMVNLLVNVTTKSGSSFNRTIFLNTEDVPDWIKTSGEGAEIIASGCFVDELSTSADVDYIKAKKIGNIVFGRNASGNYYVIVKALIASDIEEATLPITTSYIVD